MPRLDFIPKGSQVVHRGNVIAVTKRDLFTGEIPYGSDFDPELEQGTTLDIMHMRFEGVYIYVHPNFVELSSADFKKILEKTGK